MKGDGCFWQTLNPVKLIILLFYFNILFLPHVSAQNPSILPDGTMGTRVLTSGADYIISDGTVRGTNQFHSFEKFGLRTNEIATFTGPASIENIIGRVTGGEISSIDGLLRSDIPGANLFLINPNGFMFGPHAALNLQGSFHATTADYLRLSDGGIFYADPSKASVLSVAPPSAFGFLSDKPAPISVQESSLEVLEGQIISLTGGDIEITGGIGGSMSAPGGKISLVSVAYCGETVLNDTEVGGKDSLSSFDQLGTISLLNHASLDTSGMGGGTVLIRGGRFVMEASSIRANVTGPSSGMSDVKGVDINVREDAIVTDSSIMETKVLGGVAEDSHGIRIKAANLEIDEASSVNSLTQWGSQGNGGPIELNADSIRLNERGTIRSGTGGSGHGGGILVNTGIFEIRNRGLLISAAYSGSGNGGNIEVNASTIAMSNEEYPGYLTGISTRTYGLGIGDAGNITIRASELEMLPRTEISTPTWSSGKGGNIFANVAGRIIIKGTREFASNGVIIPTGFFANTFGSGNGGNVTIFADSLEMTTEASIQVNAYYTGNAGNASIHANNIRIADASFISSTGYFGWKGNAGSVELIANNISISGPESSMDPFRTDFTGISTSSSKWEGLGGDIHITTGNLTVTDRGTIESIAWGPDPGGNIQIEAKNIDILNGANINASTFGSGRGGEISIVADKLRISGVHPELFTDMAGRPSLSPSGIGSQAVSSGSAGAICLTTKNLEILDGGRFTAETFGSGDAGEINIRTHNLLISGINEHLAKFLSDSGSDPKWAGAGLVASTNSYIMGDQATGNGGNIRISASDVWLENGGFISTETETPGAGGKIEIASDNMFLDSASVSATSEFSPQAGKAGDISLSCSGTFFSDKSSITTAADVAHGGDITLSAADVRIINHSSISARSSGLGNAGNISVCTGTYNSRYSKITTEAEKSDGGNVNIKADDLLYLINSEFTASVGGGPETTGGNISIDPDFVILKNSKIIANAYEGRGGNIRITSGVFLSDPNSIVDASSALGINGTVDIRSPVTNVSETIAPLPKDFESAAELLRERCKARMFKGKYSSFVVGGRDAIPIEPGNLLPSPM